MKQKEEKRGYRTEIGIGGRPTDPKHPANRWEQNLLVLDKNAATISYLNSCETGSLVAWEINMEHSGQRLARQQSVLSAAMARLAVITIIACMSSSGLAQDFDAGKLEYQSSCETCHGADGKGKGPLSAQLKLPPAGLTVLAKKNNGVFPVMHVYEVIDGRQAISGHGTRDMPIWGNRYSVEQIQTQQALRNRPYYDPEATVRVRILSIIDYLYRIQE